MTDSTERVGREADASELGGKRRSWFVAIWRVFHALFSTSSLKWWDQMIAIFLQPGALQEQPCIVSSAIGLGSIFKEGKQPELPWTKTTAVHNSLCDILHHKLLPLPSAAITLYVKCKSFSRCFQNVFALALFYTVPSLFHAIWTGSWYSL